MCDFQSVTRYYNKIPLNLYTFKSLALSLLTSGSRLVKILAPTLQQTKVLKFNDIENYKTAHGI